jgi:nicotinamide mononucleotide adenylyltransferase
MTAHGIPSPWPEIAFTGRFQPFHGDHLDMVRHALSVAQQVVIGITNPDGAPRTAHPGSAHRHLDAANPFTYAQREQLVDAALRVDGIARSRYRIVPFPLDEPALWPALLAPGTPQLVRVFSDWEREKVRRFAAAGYPPIVLQGDPARRLKATDLRESLQRGDTLLEAVPPGARELLAGWFTPTGVDAHG